LLNTDAIILTNNAYTVNRCVRTAYVCVTLLRLAFSFVGERIRVPAKRKWKLRWASPDNFRTTFGRL